MAEKKENRGGYRPGAGRKPIPPDDIARMKRMKEVGNSDRQIAKTLGYTHPSVSKYTRGDDGDE